MRLVTGARSGTPARPAVLSPGRAQWRLLCVPARAAEGEGARARGEAHARARPAGGGAGAPGGLFVAPRPGFLSGGVGERAHARAPAVDRGPGMWEGVARAPVMAAASFVWRRVAGRRCVRPTSGGGREGGRVRAAPAGEGSETEVQGAPGPSPASFLPQAATPRPVSAGRALRPGRPRFRSGKFCDAGDSGEEGGRAQGPLRAPWRWALGTRAAAPGWPSARCCLPLLRVRRCGGWPRGVVCVFTFSCFSWKGPRVVYVG